MKAKVASPRHTFIMEESKIGDHAEFKDEEVEGHNERSQHAVTSRYNLGKGMGSPPAVRVM